MPFLPPNQQRQSIEGQRLSNHSTDNFNVTGIIWAVKGIDMPII